MLRYLKECFRSVLSDMSIRTALFHTKMLVIEVIILVKSTISDDMCRLSKKPEGKLKLFWRSTFDPQAALWHPWWFWKQEFFDAARVPCFFSFISPFMSFHKLYKSVCLKMISNLLSSYSHWFWARSRPLCSGVPCWGGLNPAGAAQTYSDQGPNRDQSISSHSIRVDGIWKLKWQPHILWLKPSTRAVRREGDEPGVITVMRSDF